MNRASGLLSGLALVLAAAACGKAGSGSGPDGSCTQLGCGPAVVVTVDRPGGPPLEACVGSVCSSPGIFPSIQDVPLGDEVEVVVRRGGGGAVVARATAKPVRSRPNGKGCEPECRSVRLRVAADGRLVPI